MAIVVETMAFISPFFVFFEKRLARLSDVEKERKKSTQPFFKQLLMTTTFSSVFLLLLLLLLPPTFYAPSSSFSSLCVSKLNHGHEVCHPTMTYAGLAIPVMQPSSLSLETSWIWPGAFHLTQFDAATGTTKDTLFLEITRTLRAGYLRSSLFSATIA